MRSLHPYLLSSNHKGMRDPREMQEKTGENSYDFAGEAEKDTGAGIIVSEA
jgi:hypothetical protein